MRTIREGVKKNLIVADLSVKESSGQPCPQPLGFKKEKKMQNVLKQKNMYYDENVCKIYIHLGLFAS